MGNELGDYLRSLRGNRSLREISSLSKGRISHNYISDSEKGVTGRGNEFRPSPEKLKVFSEVYGTSYNHLMNLAGYTESIPEWATEEDVIKVEKFLDEQTKMTLGGEELSKEKADQVRNILRGALWEELEKQKGSR